jgi:translation elongation factor EF-Tu-like GTPase
MEDHKKEKWECTKPHINVGTLGHRDYSRCKIISAVLHIGGVDHKLMLDNDTDIKPSS